MKTNYYLLGSEAIEILTQEGLDALIDYITEGIITGNDIYCDVVIINRDTDYDELLEAVIEFDAFFKIDKEMYTKINSALNGECEKLINEKFKTIK